MKRLIFIIIKIYQNFISVFLPQSCRFHPSCSCYCREAIEKHGFFRGLWFFLKRIIKCHPFNPGGYDPVPDSAHPRK